jgi:hypothetical protein
MPSKRHAEPDKKGLIVVSLATTSLMNVKPETYDFLGTRNNNNDLRFSTLEES